MRPDQAGGPPGTIGPTPSQTIGPFFRFGLDWLAAEDLVAPGAPGAVVLTGRIFDGGGVPLPDAMVEIWQADADGSFDAAGDVEPGTWSGFGRSLSDGNGRYRFTTVVPGTVDEHQAPHIDVTVFGRGLLQRLVTRVYFPDQPANDTDPVLAALDADRRATLLAHRRHDGGAFPADPVLTFDIRLQGDRETVFFVW